MWCQDAWTRRLYERVHCVTHSHLKRTAQLSGIMQWMGLANDMSNPNFVPPTDAELMMAYYNKAGGRGRSTAETCVHVRTRVSRVSYNGVCFDGVMTVNGGGKENQKTSVEGCRGALLMSAWRVACGVGGDPAMR